MASAASKRDSLPGRTATPGFNTMGPPFDWEVALALLRDLRIVVKFDRVGVDLVEEYAVEVDIELGRTIGPAGIGGPGGVLINALSDGGEVACRCGSEDVAHCHDIGSIFVRSDGRAIRPSP